MTQHKHAEEISLPEILIIGAGNLGTSFYSVLHSIYPDRVHLAGNKPFNFFENKSIKEKHYSNGLSELQVAQSGIIFITVQDDKIIDAVKALLNFKIRDKFIFHVSGSKDAGILGLLEKEGAYTAGLHPLQTFPHPFTPVKKWEKIIWSFQGNNRCYDVANFIVKKLKGRLLHLTAEQKKALHIAGIFSANYVVGLLALAEQILEKAGVSDIPAHEILQPLLQGVTANYKNAEATDILSGPLKRGDVDVIQKHIEYLKVTEGPVDLYKALAQSILTNKNFSISKRDKLSKLA